MKETDPKGALPDERPDASNRGPRPRCASRDDHVSSVAYRSYAIGSSSKTSRHAG